MKKPIDRSSGKVRVAAEAAMNLRLSHHAPLIIDFDIRPITGQW
jgi:hypothetical protein